MKMVWTQFMDMHSGGGQKLDWAYIYIEAAKEEAKVIFYHRFGRNPEKVTCTCYGGDYSINEGEDVAQLTAYQRNCAYDDENDRYIEEQNKRYGKTSPWISLAEYMNDKETLFIHASEIKPEEKTGKIPRQGFVWVDESE